MTPTAPSPPTVFAAQPHRNWVWILPLLTALLLVIGVCLWMQFEDLREAENSRATLASDALSAERQLQAWIQVERERLDAVARLVDDGGPEALSLQASVIDALRSRWLSVTWLDDSGRTVVTLPSVLLPDPVDEGGGQRGHWARLEAPLRATAIHAGGKLVVRYSLDAMLSQAIPWWTEHRYIASLVTDRDAVIATTARSGEQSAGLSHRISFEPPLPGVFLQLTQRDRVLPWYRTFPLGLIGLVLALLAWTTWLLRGQIRGVERAEAKWRSEAAWRRAMEDSLTVGLRAFDLNGRLIYANPRFFEMTGYSAGELLGREPPMPYWLSDSSEARFDRFRRAGDGALPEGHEMRWRCKDGTVLDVMAFEAPLVDEHGDRVGWMGSVIDVTERRRAQEAERLAAERMAQQARLTSLGEIASSLAHQLNQPLMAIASYNAGLRNLLGAAPGADARVLTALDRQAEQIKHAGHIVHRIRDFLLRRAPRPERIELRRIVDESLELLAADLRRQGVEVKVVHGADLPLVNADPILVGQVVVNLVRNAVDASKAGPAPWRVEARTLRLGGNAAVQVRDHGAGLLGRGIEQLASPFYSTKGDGMGLGLAICRTVIEAHAGRLEAEDAPGGGALFRFTLPAAEDDGE